jgi:hypothetical protein
MALKGLVGKLSEKIAGSLAGKPGRGPWQPAQGGYPRLMLMDADVLKDLQETGGVFALWHNGVRPQWIGVAGADSLGQAFEVLQADSDILLYDRNDGVFVAWAECGTENRSRVVAYLRSVLEPAIEQIPGDQALPQTPDEEPLEFPVPAD